MQAATPATRQRRKSVASARERARDPAMRASAMLAIGSDALIRLPEVLSIVGVSASTWWEWCRTSRAPSGIKLSTRVTCWRATDIRAWMDRVAAAAKGAS